MIAQLGTLFVIFIVSMIPIAIGKKMSIRLNAKQKKWWVMIHILFVILYFSGLLGTLLFSLFTRFIDDRSLVNAAYKFHDYFDWFLIIPGGIGSLITGFWLATVTWGVTRHYWVIAKWGGTITAILFGSTIMDTWIHNSFQAFSGSIDLTENPDYLHNQRMMLIGNVIVVANAVFLTVISYLKPWGKRRKYR